MKNSEKNLLTLIRALLIFGSLYLFIEGIIHLFALRLISVTSIWPQSAILYASWMGRFYGSFTVLVAILLFYIQRDVTKFRTILTITAIFAVFHAFMLVFGAATEPFDAVYRQYPSLSFWIPFYNIFIIIEAIILFLYAIVIFVWRRNT